MRAGVGGDRRPAAEGVDATGGELPAVRAHSSRAQPRGRHVLRVLPDGGPSPPAVGNKLSNLRGWSVNPTEAGQDSSIVS